MKKFPNKQTFELEKVEELSLFLKKYIELIFGEFEKILKIKKDETKKSEIEKDNFMLNYTLVEECHNDLIRKTRIYYYQEIENISEINFSFEKFLDIRKKSMNLINPKFILRNYIAQKVIEESEKGNNKDLNNLLDLLTSPFDDHEDFEFEGNFDADIEKAYNICVSCSS